jgi:hypothetical protein
MYGCEHGLDLELKLAWSESSSITSAAADLRQLLHSQGNLQLAVPGHELLELLCQLMDGEQQQQHGSSSGSRGGSLSDDSSSMQREALQHLAWQWMPSVNLCRQLQQQQQQQQVSSAAAGSDAASVQLMHNLILQACESAAARAILEDAAPVSREQQQQQLLASGADVAVQLLASAADAQQKLATQMAETCSKQLAPAEFLGEQLRVLGGALVLQFVSAARAAGGPAWQQEVPLQAVVLFGALEQMQGMALAAVQQQDVQDARKAAAAQQQQQRECEAVPRSKRGSIAINIKDSSSEECDDEDQQQQQQMREHQQDAGFSAEEQPEQQHAQAAPASGQLLMMQKLLDIMHFTRQFADLNAALNSSTGNSPSSSNISSSSMPPNADIMSVSDLHAAGGPVHALYPEPCTLNAWAQPSTGCAAAAAGGSSSRAAPSSFTAAAADDLDCAGSSAAAAADASNGSEQQQQLAPQALRDAAPLQQLYSATLKGALVLFAAQRRAFLQVLTSSFGQHLLDDSGTFLRQCSDDYLRQAEGSPAMQMVAEEICNAAHMKRDVRSIDSPHQLLPAMCFGQEQLQELRERVGRQLQQQGIDGSWVTLHAVAGSVGAGAINSDSDSDSDSPRVMSHYGVQRSNGSSSRGQHDPGSSSSRGGQLGGWQRQQQHAGEEHDSVDLAAAVRAGGLGLR